MGGLLPVPAGRGRGGSLQFQGQPSDHSTPPTPGGAWASAPRPTMPSMAFALSEQARLVSTRRWTGVTTLQASLHVADWSVAPLRFAPHLSMTHGSLTTGTLASPRTGLLAALRLSLSHVTTTPSSSWRPNRWTHSETAGRPDHEEASATRSGPPTARRSVALASVKDCCHGSGRVGGRRPAVDVPR